MAAGPHPAKVAEGRELDEFARGARVATVAAADMRGEEGARAYRGLLD